MSSRKNNQKTLLDFRSPDDNCWYSMLPSVLENKTLVLKYLDFPDESYSVENFKTQEAVEDFKKRFRPACVQLQDRQCKDVELGMGVCCSFIKGSGGDKEVKFYNGVIDSVDRKKHQGMKKTCRCSFEINWLEGPKAGSKETMGIARICKLETGTPLIDLKLADFLGMLEAQFKLPSEDFDKEDAEVKI
ncbi:hypothetical protein MKW94_005220 [Papaver nudicaule]|uniref:SAWADEE domain-containing protein n=1 Tax=Papaver nudicaule TaxID=74823 RepID=A0AA41V2C1_PAPNU|nr:hypothetical protein [Papaver nudicaule]